MYGQFVIAGCENIPEEEPVPISDMATAIKTIGEFAQFNSSIKYARFNSITGKEIKIEPGARTKFTDDDDLGIAFSDDLDADIFNELDELFIKHVGVSINDIISEELQTSGRIHGCKMVRHFYFYSDGSWAVSVYKYCNGFIVDDMKYDYAATLYVPLQPVSVSHPKINTFLKVSDYFGTGGG